MSSDLPAEARLGNPELFTTTVAPTLAAEATTAGMSKGRVARLADTANTLSVRTLKLARLRARGPLTV